MTRPDSTPGPIERNLSPEKVSAFIPGFFGSSFFASSFLDSSFFSSFVSFFTSFLVPAAVFFSESLSDFCGEVCARRLNDAKAVTRTKMANHLIRSSNSNQNCHPEARVVRRRTMQRVCRAPTTSGATRWQTDMYTVFLPGQK